MGAALICKAFRMNDDARKIITREERLAAKLRENLRRRKAQSRAASQPNDDSPGPQPLPKCPRGG